MPIFGNVSGNWTFDVFGAIIYLAATEVSCHREFIVRGSGIPAVKAVIKI